MKVNLSPAITKKYHCSLFQPHAMLSHLRINCGAATCQAEWLQLI